MMSVQYTRSETGVGSNPNLSFATMAMKLVHDLKSGS